MQFVKYSFSFPGEFEHSAFSFYRRVGSLTRRQIENGFVKSVSSYSVPAASPPTTFIINRFNDGRDIAWECYNGYPVGKRRTDDALQLIAFRKTNQPFFLPCPLQHNRLFLHIPFPDFAGFPWPFVPCLSLSAEYANAR